MPKLATDLAVSLQEDRPGMLARAVAAIAQAELNLDGYAEIEGLLHVLTGDAAAARQALENAGFEIRREQQALVVEVADRPGVAATIFQRLADAGLNVKFAYLAANNKMVIGVSDLERGLQLVSE